MPTLPRRLLSAAVLTGLVAVTAAGCIAVPVGGHGHVYGPPAPVIVVPGRVHRGHHHGHPGRHHRGHHRSGYRR